MVQQVVIVFSHCTIVKCMDIGKGRHGSCLYLHESNASSNDVLVTGNGSAENRVGGSLLLHI